MPVAELSTTVPQLSATGMANNALKGYPSAAVIVIFSIKFQDNIFNAELPQQQNHLSVNSFMYCRLISATYITAGCGKGVENCNFGAVFLQRIAVTTISPG